MLRHETVSGSRQSERHNIEARGRIFVYKQKRASDSDRGLADEDAKEDGDGAHARAHEEAERVAARVFRNARAPEITSDDLVEPKIVSWRTYGR